MVGILLGVSSAMCFAAAAICFKIGQRSRPDDNGLWVSVLVNTLILGAIVSFLLWPPWSLSGLVALVLGGVVGTVGGRSSNLKAIRLIGPSRSNAFLTGNPVFTAIIGWFVLGETLGVQEFAGGALVILGLLWIVQARSSPASLGPSESPKTGYLWAIAAPMFFGTSFVARKWGLERFPGPVIGAFIGSAAAMLVVSAMETSTGNLARTIRANLGKGVSWWYVGAGLFTTLALLSQFNAFSYLPAWVVGILQGMQGLFTLVFGWLFLREEERIDRRLVGAILVVLVGVILIGLEV